jgi:hypothetical protein
LLLPLIKILRGFPPLSRYRAMYVPKPQSIEYL